MPAYKKYDILKTVIQNLYENTNKYDLIINFDHHDDDLTEICNYITQCFPNVIINRREQRYNLDLNVVMSIHEGFFKYNYDRLFYFEDDVSSDSTCLATLENLMNWTDKNLPHVGIVQSWNYNLTENPFKTEYYKLHRIRKIKLC
jgi:hypothetical protein